MKLKIQEKINELNESIDHIVHFIELIKNGNPTYVKPLSVELRKLFSDGKGNQLLARVGEEVGLKVKFPIRVKKPLMPPTYTEVSVDLYLDEFRFFQEGKEYTRRDIIHLVADMKGAHLDDDEKSFHRFEKTTFLPVGNPSKGGVYPLGTKYLIDIAQTTINVVPNYIKEIETLLNKSSLK